MRNTLYAIAFILLIIWVIGFFGYNAGSGIHLLPVLAIAAFIQGFTKAEDPVYIKKNQTWKIQE